MNCQSVPLSPQLGTLVALAGSGVEVEAAGRLPPRAVRVITFDGGLLASFSDRSVRLLAGFPGLDAGAAVASLSGPEGGQVAPLLATDGTRLLGVVDPSSRDAGSTVTLTSPQGLTRDTATALGPAGAQGMAAGLLVHALGVGIFAQPGVYLFPPGRAPRQVLGYDDALKLGKRPPLQGLELLGGGWAAVVGLCPGLQDPCVPEARVVPLPSEGEGPAIVGLSHPQLFSSPLVNGFGAAGDTILLSVAPSRGSSVVARVDRVDVLRLSDGGVELSGPRPVFQAKDLCNRFLFFAPGPDGTLLLGRADREGAGRHLVQLEVSGGPALRGH